MKHFKMNDKVYMTESAAENYGAKYLGKPFLIHAISKSTEDHPGYDEGVAPEWLYDLTDAITLKPFDNSLYDYELTEVEP